MLLALIFQRGKRSRLFLKDFLKSRVGLRVERAVNINHYGENRYFIMEFPGWIDVIGKGGKRMSTVYLCEYEKWLSSRRIRGSNLCWLDPSSYSNSRLKGVFPNSRCKGVLSNSRCKDTLWAETSPGLAGLFS